MNKDTPIGDFPIEGSSTIIESTAATPLEGTELPILGLDPIETGRKLLAGKETILTEEEIKKFVNWMLGKETEPPQIMQKLSLNIANKLNFAMAFLMTYNMRRAQSLLEFISKAESEVFAPSKIYTSSESETKELYKLANNRFDSIVEFIRKYVYQNKDFMEGFDTKADKLKQLLMSLSEDKIDAITEKLEKGEI